VLTEEVAGEIVDSAAMNSLFAQMGAEKRLVIVTGTKQISWLSTLSATFRPNERAMARISGLDIVPSGVSALAQLCLAELKRKYDWSLRGSTPLRKTARSTLLSMIA
jgi:hypothetical protein